MNHLQKFLEQGWTVFDHDDALHSWVQSALPHCRAAVRAPQNAQWFRHGNTWFVGVNALDNDPQGAVAEGRPINGAFEAVIAEAMGLTNIQWDRAQISVCYPGYPTYSGDEPEAAHRYRIRRDAAHIDGLNRVGPERRRHLLEQHAFILGIPMIEASPGASPFVVWEGSHHIARECFSAIYQSIDASEWPTIDVTEAYQRVRQKIFEQCERITIEVKPGQSFLAHRHILHGMAPWADDATASPDGRMICYFRPEFLRSRGWLEAG